MVRAAPDPGRTADASSSGLCVRLLGQLDVRVGDARLAPLTSTRARSLLGYLVLHADVPHTRQRLAYLLWPDSTDGQARTNLRNILHLLRRASPELDQRIEATPGTLQWRAGASCRVDVAEFVAAVARGDTAEAGSDARVAALRDAMDLYVGDLLDDCYDDWLIEDRERLRDQYVSVLRRLTEALAARSEHAEAMRVGRLLTRCDPLNEDNHRLLVAVHAAAGDRAGAMRAYHECVTILERELGVEPSTATRAAYAEMMQAAATTDAEEDLRGTGQAALVGRSAELTQLRDRWRDAEAGRSQLVIVTGEAGVGKTRLVEELASWCAHRGGVVGRARSYPTEGELGYGVVIAWLRTEEVATQLRRAAPSDVADLARLLPELGTPADHALGTVEESDRLRLFESVARALTATGRPTLLVADDAQWSDPASLRLIHYLVRSRPDAGVCVVATVRQEDLDDTHPLAAVVGGLQVLDRLAEVPLARLSRPQTAELARDLAGAELDEARVDSLFAETEGNPLFVVETFRAGWGAAAPGRGMSPKLQAVIGSRLRQLSAPARQLLEMAATVGRAFTAALVQHAAGLDDQALVRGLDELWRRGLIREHDDDAYDFSHGKIRDAAYDGLSPATRRRNHRLVAEALVSLNPHDLDTVSGQVAANFDRAGRPAEAIEWYRRAAVQAQRMSSDGEAVRVLERALALVATLPEPQRLSCELSVLSMLPTALAGVDGYASDRQAVVQERAVEVASVLGVALEPPVLRSLVMFSLCRDEYSDAADAAARLRASAGAGGDEGFVVESHYLSGIAAFWASDLARAQRHFTEVVARFRDEQRPEHLVRFGNDPKIVCLSRLANTLWFLGDPDAARAAREDAVSMAERLAHPFTSDIVYIFAAMLAADLGEDDEFCRYAAASGDGRSGSPLIDIKITGLHGYAEALEGRADGIGKIRSAVARCAGRNLAPGYRAILLRLLVAAHDRVGDAKGGLGACEEALSLGSTRLWEPETRRLRAEFLAVLGGPPTEIDDELRRAATVASEQGSVGPQERIRRSRARLLQVC